MDNSSLMSIAIVTGVVVTAIILPIFLKWPWLTVFLPWTIPVFKAYLLRYVPISRVIDISVLIFAFLIVFLGVGFLLRKLVWDKRYTLLLFLHFAVVAILSLSYSWTTAPSYGGRKLGLFAIFNTISFVLGASVIRSVADARKVAKGYGLFALLFGIVMIVTPSYTFASEYQLRQTIGGTSPLNAAFTLAIGATCGLIWFTGKNLFMTILSGVIWILSLVGINRAGARASLVQVLTGTVMISLFYKGLHRKSRIVLVCLVLILGVTVGIPIITAQGPSRITSFLQDPSRVFLENERFYLWAQALAGVPEKPVFGHGVGAFASNVMGQDKSAFPHNFFIEVLYEGGLLSFIFFVLFWFFVVFYMFSWRRSIPENGVLGDLYVRDLWIVIFFSAALGSVFHWDISGQRLLWLLAGIMLGTTRACWQEAMFQWQYDEEYYYLADTQAESETDVSVVHI